jgi:hypothetical protein
MKIIPILIIILLAVLSISCEESFSPKTPVSEEYILYCVLNADTTFQTAYLSKSYDVENYDPLTNKADPSIEGAEIKLILNDKDVYKFTETTTQREDTSRYKTPFKFYCMNNLKINDNDKVEIQVVLNNGKVLTSSSVAPPISFLFFETQTVEYFPNVRTPQTLDIKFGWTVMGSQYGNKMFYFYPQMELIYSKSDAPDKLYKVSIPKMIAKNGTVIDNSVTSARSAYFYYESIVKVMELISEGDSQKDNYVIHGAEFTLLFVDKYSGSYLAAANTFRDEFSVRIDALDYSNIQNGLGLFGVYANKKVKVHFAKSFIDTFGYKSFNE